MSKKGEIVSVKELEPQKGAKIAKRAQKKSSVEGTVAKRASESRLRVQIWNPPWNWIEPYSL